VISDHQAIALFKEFKSSKNKKLSALKTGMDRKTAAKYIKKNKLPSELVSVRNWRTHPDKLLPIWDDALSFLESEPDLEASSLFEHLLDMHPDKLQETQLRSFQRKVKEWRIKYGADKEIFFDQITVPGKMAQVDWLDMNQVKIIIEGEHYKHKLIHFTLNHSNIESATICKSESVVAIKNGLRDFLYNVAGKSPQVLQIDNSSAATHRLIKDQSKRVFNDEYLEILKYYNIIPQKNNIRKPNENGVVESQNGHLRNKIEQMLKIRGSKSFSSLVEYNIFIDKIITKLNKRRELKFQEELPHMNAIPSSPLPDYQELYVTIRNRSTVNIKNMTYSVPSKLIGSKLKAKIYEDKIELCSGRNIVYSLPRLFGTRSVLINYRHVINSLIRKPGAFENYTYKEELFPTQNFRNLYERLIEDKDINHRSSNLEYLRILKLAADNIEEDVDTAIAMLISSNELPLTVDTISNLILDKSVLELDDMNIFPDLNIYDHLFLSCKATTGEVNNDKDNNEKLYH
jgi:hypothetical protein